MSLRAAHASTLQALELVNGELLTHWLSRGARRMLGELRREPLSLYNRTVAGRNASSTTAFEMDVIRGLRLWLVVQDNGSNVPEVLEPAWARRGVGRAVWHSAALFIDPPIAPERSGMRTGSRRQPAQRRRLPREESVVVVYDIAGRGFTMLPRCDWSRESASEIGSTLNPQLRFFVFDAEPNMERLLPPATGYAAATASTASHGRRCDRSGVSATRLAVCLRAEERKPPKRLCATRRKHTSVRPWARGSACGP